MHQSVETGAMEDPNNLVPLRPENTFSQLTKYVTAAVISTAVVTAISLLSVVAYELFRLDDNNEYIANLTSYCHTDDCLEAVKQIQKFINESGNPCENFYRFACGALLNMSHADARALLKNEERVGKRLNHILNYNENINGIHGLPYKLNKRCLGTKGDVPDWSLLDYVKIFGELKFPIIQKQFDPSVYIWTKEMTRLRESGYAFDYLFALHVRINYESKFALFIDVPSVQQHPDVRSHLMTNFYKHFLKDIAENKATLSQDLEEVKKFKKSLEAAVKKTIKESYGKATYKTVSDLTHNDSDSSFAWYEYFSKILKRSPAGINETKVFSNQFGYFEELRTLLKRTDNRVIANYIGCRVLEEAADYFPYSQNMKARSCLKMPSKIPIEDKCRDDTTRHTQALLISNYEKTFPQKDTLETFDNLVVGLKDAFLRIFDEADWLSRTAANKLKKKVEKLSVVGGYSKAALNATLLNKLYGGVDLKNRNYLEYYLEFNKAKTDFMIGMVDQDAKPEDLLSLLGTDVFERNAVYMQCETTQSAAVYMGTLDGGTEKLLSKGPEYTKNGGVGWIIGHKLAHSVDSENIKFDVDGNYGNIQGLEQLEKHFKEREECLLQQYNGFSHGQLKVNATKGIREIYADNLGLLAAYDSYSTWLAKKPGGDVKLKGLEKYTDQQLFWLSAAQSMCESLTIAQEEHLLTKTEHLPNEMRVNGAFQNSEGFSSDFKCSSGDGMNPFAKCHIFGTDVSKKGLTTRGSRGNY